MRSLGFILLLLLPVQSPDGGSNNHNAMKSARSPAMTETLHQLSVARSREDEAGLQLLATKLGELARVNPQDAEASLVAARAHNALLNLYVLRDQKDRARRELDRAMERIDHAIALDGQRADAYALRAELFGWKVGLANPMVRVFSGMNNAGKIKENLQRALALDPENPNVHISMGMEDYYKPAAAGGSLERAASHFRNALQFDSENADAWMWLGLALKGQKKNTEAKKAFEKVLQLDPQNVRAAREISSLK